MTLVFFATSVCFGVRRLCAAVGAVRRTGARADETVLQEGTDLAHRARVFSLRDFPDCV